MLHDVHTRLSGEVLKEGESMKAGKGIDWRGMID